MNNRNAYIQPDISEITLDTEISIMLQSADNTPASYNNENALNSIPQSDPFRNQIS